MIQPLTLLINKIDDLYYVTANIAPPGIVRIEASSHKKAAIEFLKTIGYPVVRSSFFEPTTRIETQELSISIWAEGYSSANKESIDCSEELIAKPRGF